MSDFPFTVGVDVGKVNDFTALCIIKEHSPEERATLLKRRQENFARKLAEKVTSLRPAHAASMLTVGISRIPLNTKYPLQAKIIIDLISRPPLLNNCELVVDATGVGIPFLDILEEQGAEPIGITIHGGTAVTVAEGGRRFRVPKGDLIAAAQIIIQQRDLEVMKTAMGAAKGKKDALPVDWDELSTQLLNYQTKRKPETGHETYDAREHEHDDIVLALALAVWRRRPPGGRVIISGTGDMAPNLLAQIEAERAAYNAIGLQHPIDLMALDQKLEQEKEAARLAQDARLRPTVEEAEDRERLLARIRGR